MLGIVRKLFHKVLWIGFPILTSLSFGWRIVILGNRKCCRCVQTTKQTIQHALFIAHVGDFVRDTVLSIDRIPNVGHSNQELSLCIHRTAGNGTQFAVNEVVAVVRLSRFYVS